MTASPAWPQRIPRWAVVALAVVLLVPSVLLARPALDSGPDTTAAAACTDWALRSDEVKIVDLAWGVTMAYQVARNKCGDIKLTWKQCSKTHWNFYTVTITWCDAYRSSDGAIDVGFNATVSSPGITRSCWAREWEYVWTVLGPAQRSGC